MVGLVSMLKLHNLEDFMKIAVVVYASVIGRMWYWSLVLSKQEYEAKYMVMETTIKMLNQKKMTDQIRDYIRLIHEQLGGPMKSIQYYGLASTIFVISDSVLGYSKFAD